MTGCCPCSVSESVFILNSIRFKAQVLIRALPDPLSANDLKNAWSEVNAAATFGIEGFSVENWLKKHPAVSDEDFARDRTRNRLSVVLNRTNHACYHAGQITLVK